MRDYIIEHCERHMAEELRDKSEAEQAGDLKQAAYHQREYENYVKWRAERLNMIKGA